MRLSLSSFSIFIAAVTLLCACSDDIGFLTTVDCDEVYFHPDCFDEPSPDAAMDVEPCGDDEFFDETSGECIVCRHGELFDPVAGECIPDCTLGGFVAYACDPVEGYLPGVEVRIEGRTCDGGDDFLWTTTSDDTGLYEFHDLPPGDHTISISDGDFETNDSITIDPGEVTDRRSDALMMCTPPEDPPEIALVTGPGDDIGALLDGLDLEYTSLGDDPQQLADFLFSQALLDHDVLLIESGAIFEEIVNLDEPMDNVSRGLRKFVELGNSILATGQAHSYLEVFHHDIIDVDDTIEFAASNQPVTAETVSWSVEHALDADEVEIQLVDDGSPFVEGVEPDTDTDIRADVLLDSGDLAEGVPLMLTWEDPDRAHNPPMIRYTAFAVSDQEPERMEALFEYFLWNEI